MSGGDLEGTPSKTAGGGGGEQLQRSRWWPGPKGPGGDGPWRQGPRVARMDLATGDRKVASPENPANTDVSFPRKKEPVRITGPSGGGGSPALQEDEGRPGKPQ